MELLRLVLSRAGLRDKPNNLHWALPPDREKALVVIYLIYSRAKNPLSFRDIILLARKMTEKADCDFFSLKFMSDVCERHTDVLLKKKGTIA